MGISGGVTGGQALVLSPGAPFAVSADGAVAAQLLGDLASYTAAPDFSSSMLMIPQGSSGAPPMLACSMCSSISGMAVTWHQGHQPCLTPVSPAGKAVAPTADPSALSVL